MKKVLYAEDEVYNRKYLELLLGQNGINCDLAVDGVSALALFRQNSYSVVILDQHMPGLSGEKVAKEIRTVDPNIPLIAITGDDSQVPKLKDAGFTRVFIKPLHGEEYIAAIARFAE